MTNLVIESDHLAKVMQAGLNAQGIRSGEKLELYSYRVKQSYVPNLPNTANWING